MQDRIFIDTSIFIYAHLEEKNNDKCRIAVKCLKEAGSKIVVSAQVLDEYYSVMLNNEIEDKIIQQKLDDIITECRVGDIVIGTIKKAWKMRRKYKYSYWDSLILASALENGCSILYSEDMKNKQVIEKYLIIVNPFETAEISKPATIS